MKKYQKIIFICMADFHIGLDFGTSQTKVCLLNKNSDVREFLKFDNNSYFLPVHLSTSLTFIRSCRQCSASCHPVQNNSEMIEGGSKREALSVRETREVSTVHTLTTSPPYQLIRFWQYLR